MHSLFAIIMGVCLIVNIYAFGIARNTDMDNHCSHFRAACKYKEEDNLNCNCDSDCHIYDDCCIDAPPAEDNSKHTPPFSCITSSTSANVYGLTSCEYNWQGPTEVKEKCENSDLSDPILAMPVTDVRTNITYNSYYCAECNNAISTHLRTWSISMTCSSSKEQNYPEGYNVTETEQNYLDEEYNVTETEQNYFKYNVTENEEELWDKLYYNVNSNDWGIDLNVSELSTKFLSCSIKFDISDHLEPHLRKCIPSVSTCDSSTQWKESLEEQCQAYMGVVYTGTAYRNKHCAECNGFPPEYTNCDPPVVAFGEKKKPLSFTLLLDVNLKDGSKVGETKDTRCPDGDKWDPFFKKCRTVVCGLPGLKLVDGKCVKE